MNENLCLRLMEHAGKVIFGQVGDLLVYFRLKVPDFLLFLFLVHLWSEIGQIWEEFPKFARFWTINATKIKKSKIGDFTSEIH